MPRKPKTKHPIRALREIIGKSQREFAHSLGISPSALKRIENGTLKLSLRVRRKIVYETLIDSRCLNGELRTLRTWRGDQYTKEFYKRWKDGRGWQDEGAAKAAAQWLSWGIEILLRASVLGYRKKLRLVQAEIAATLERCSVDFDLQRPINEVLAKERPRFSTKRPLKWNDLIRPRVELEAWLTT